MLCTELKTLITTLSSDAEIEAITGKELVEKLKKLNNVEQTVIYYGPLSFNQLTAKLNHCYKVPASCSSSS